MGRPRWSVAIPSFNGREALALTLDSIAAAEVDLAEVEVIVVDDNSADGTFEAFVGRDYPFAFEIHRAAFGNQSATTNAAIARARGELVLCSAQDIVFHPEMFRRHRAMHERFAGREIAVLGYLPYAEHLRISPLMTYLVNGGYQFGYHMIQDPLRVPPNFLYAPNVSLRRETLERVGGFDEQFPYGSQDTDLGIRLVKDGVRIVYEARAIGFHNHPMELQGYMARQQKIGASLVRLREKHPDFEGELGTWDIVLRKALTYGEAALDRDLGRIRALEPVLEATGDRYRELWIRGYNRGEPLDRFDAAEQRILRQTQTLFECYERVLGHRWSVGFFEAALELHGVERVREIAEARFLKHHASLQLRGAAQHALAGHGIELPLVREGDAAATVIVRDVRDYATAVELLDFFEQDRNRAGNFELILIDSAGRLDPEQRRKLAPMALTIEGDDDAAMKRALARATAPLTIVIRADAGLDLCGVRDLATSLFDRFEKLGVVGGAVEQPEGWCYGLTADGKPLCAATAELADARPIGAPVPDLCVIRADVLEDWCDEPGLPWHRALGRHAAGAGLLSLYAPGLQVAAPRAAASIAPMP